MIVASSAIFILFFLLAGSTVIQPPLKWKNDLSLNNLNHTLSLLDKKLQVRIILYEEYIPEISRASFPELQSYVLWGFYCNQLHHCDSAWFSIVMISYSTTFVLWSANADHPVGENATVVFSEDGNLVLRDSDGTLVWSTNTQNKSVVQLKLSLPGRLQLLDSKNVSVWDSYDYPTETWLPGQTLSIGQQLWSTTSETNFSKGQYFLSIAPNGLKAYVNSDPPQRYYFRRSTVVMANNMTFINGSITNSMEEVVSLSKSSFLQFLKLDSDGHFRHYAWDINYNGWNILDDVFIFNYDTDCSYPKICGSYGICTLKGQCSCPNIPYLKPVDERNLNLGCNPVTPISCESSSYHRLVPLDNVSYFNYYDPNGSVAGITNQEQCKQACLKDCSCKAAMFKVPYNSSEGSCYLPSQLFSMKNYHDDQSDITGYNSFVYIKVQLEKTYKKVQHEKTHKKVGVLLGSLLGSLLSGSFLVVLVVLRIRIKRKSASKMENDDDLEQLYGLPTRFSLEELKNATDDFSKKLGQGGFGSVFEGEMNGNSIAVKRLDNAGQGTKEFLAEVMTIGNVHHMHLVRLIGFCSEKANRLLVYEYMPNGSLDKWIYYKNNNIVLEWKIRVQIITEVAKALAYLHEECRQRIIHLDIKPQNILLDDGFHAKVSDFGLSKLIDKEQSHIMTTMRGTCGYLAPEWLTSKITEKADVYSFGVVVLEVVCGRKNLDYSQNEEFVHLIGLLQDKVRECRMYDILDESNNDTQLYKEEMIEMVKLAIWCLQNDHTKRPSMGAVVKVLDGSAKLQTDVDINFTVKTVSVNPDGWGVSGAPSASLLSDGR